MDDSELSYGYSQDIYHGLRGAGGHYDRTRGDYGRGSSPERSYEYGPEPAGWGDSQDYDVSPEEAAMHIDDRGFQRGSTGPRGGRYDYGRSAYEGVESFTWDTAGPHSGRGPGGYKRSDERIHDDVCQRLTIHGAVDASRIRVEVEDAEVTLTGTVGNRREKRLAEDLADVRGVRDVHNHLRVE